MADTRIRPVDGAVMLFRKGFKVFPILQNQKKPAFEGWKTWSATEDKLFEYGKANPLANWGVHAGPSGLVIIDLDTKNGHSGAKSLLSIINPIPKTFTVSTPSGGTHLYFLGDAPPSVGILPGVDVRGRDSYVVAPGSRINEKGYDIVDFTDPQPLPDAIKTLLLKKKEPLKPLENTTVFPEGQRDQSITRYAGKLRAMGLDKDELIASLSQINQTRCVPPLPDSDIERIATSMMRYAPDISEAAVSFDKIETSSPSDPIPSTDFKGLPPPRSWLIKDWIPEGEISSLYGSGGTGKSLLSLQLAICVASGKPWLGLSVEKQLPVLAVFCEDSKEEIHRRMYDIQKAPEYTFAEANPDKVCLLWPRVGLMNDIARENDKKTDIVKGLFRAELEAALKKMPAGPKLLILDTLSDIYLGDENVREKVNKFVKTHLGSLVKEFNCTLLLLAHPSRQGANTGDQLSGSTAWENAVRNRLALIPYDKKVDTGLMCVVRMKSNYAKRGEKLVVRWDSGRYMIASSAEVNQISLSGDDRATITAMNDVMTDKPMVMTDVAMEIKKSENPLNYLSLESLKNRIKKVMGQEVEFNGYLFRMDNVAADGVRRPSYMITKRSLEKVSSFGAENASSLDEILG